jgi:5-methylcytosine-specific restriction protein A
MSPWIQPHPCGAQGCGELTHSRRCPKHDKQERHELAVRRGSPRDRGYTGKWDKAAKRFLQENPLCAECARQGRTTMADLVDHIVPAKGDQKLFWDSENWQALCSACHNRKTNSRDGGFGNRIIPRRNPLENPKTKTGKVPW